MYTDALTRGTFADFLGTDGVHELPPAARMLSIKFVTEEASLHFSDLMVNKLYSYHLDFLAAFMTPAGKVNGYVNMIRNIPKLVNPCIEYHETGVLVAPNPNPPQRRTSCYQAIFGRQSKEPYCKPLNVHPFSPNCRQPNLPHGQTTQCAAYIGGIPETEQVM